MHIADVTVKFSRLLRFTFLSIFVSILFSTNNIAYMKGPVEIDFEAPLTTCTGATDFRVGSGVYDITGPAAELGMMGYSMLDQKTAGIHTRLWARAFVIESPCNGKRVVLVNVDAGQVFQAVHQKVLQKLQQTYGNTYTAQNVLLSATHTHAGPGGYSHYAMYNLSMLGFDSQNFNAISNGIYQAIVRAHNNVADGTIKINSGDLLNTSLNRSTEAYLQNPATERAQYNTDTDKQMTLLRLQKLNGQEVGLINWFAVHGTSMGNDNLLISGDNKGYAAYLFEQSKGTNYNASETFVAGFFQGKEGDVTPNIYGGTNGGGANDFESTTLSGEKQFNKALDLYNTATEPLTGGVDYRQTYIKMDNVMVDGQYTNGNTENTCTAAIGISMLAGAEDGPGFGQEGWNCSDIEGFWPQFACSVTTTTCQAEKPIVLEMGSMQPYPWSPEVLPLQLITIGDLALIAVPFEMTTMAGRRLEQTILDQLQGEGINRALVVSLSNAYAGYVATREEYTVQHYEGASTHFGPWTLAALQQEFDALAEALAQNTSVDPGPTPRDLTCCQSTLQTGVVFDDVPLFKSFGDVYNNANSSYNRGQTVKVVFWGGHPKNNLKTQGTFLAVQRKVDGNWVTVATDNDWETKYRWKRNGIAYSHVTIEWEIPADAPTGTYRIKHYGHWKSGWNGSINAYSGKSRTFSVN